MRAIQDLKRARSGHPPSADLENDFAASFLRLAELTDDSYSLFFSLERLERARDEFPGNKLLLFNRAAAWELVGVTDEAAAAWRELLAVESGSPWSAEASGRVAVLQRPAEKRRTDEAAWSRSRLSAARERIMEELIPAWAAAVLNGRPAASEPFLREAEWLAEAVADPLSRAALARLRRAAAQPDHEELRALAAAHRQLARGIASRRRFDTRIAVATLAAAGRRLAALDSPAALLADYHRGMAIYHADRYPEARALLTRVRRTAKALHEPLLGGLSAKTLGLIAQVTGDPGAAARLYREALAEVQRSGDLRESIDVASILADGLLAAGEDKEAWHILHGALHAAWQHADPLPRYVVSAAGAAMAEKRGFAYLAVAMTRLSLAAIRETGSPPAIADSTTWYASSLITIEHMAEASAVLRQVRPLIDQMGDAATLRRAGADLDYAEGRQLLAAGRAGTALPRLRAAADYYEQAMLLTHAAPCRAAEGIARLALGDAAGAGALLDRSSILASTLDGFLPRVETYYGAGDPTVSLLESVLALHLARGKPWDALRAAAMALQRYSPAPAGQKAPGVRDLQSAAAGLRGTGRVVLLVYSLPHGLVAWRLDGKSIQTHRAAIEQPELAAAVERFLAAVERGDLPAGIRPERRELGRLLLGNLLDGLANGTTLVIVPTADLAALPWGFLAVPGGSEPLLARWPVALAPNLRLALARARPIPAAAAELLVVANPAVPRDVEAPPLPFAEEEARQLLGLFPGRASALVGERATKRLVLAGISRFAAVHWAVHGFSNAQAPRASHLVLRGADGRGDPLTVADVLGMKLPRTRIVVLAACSSSFRSTALATNALGLGEAFLAAGARAVVASGWAVDDAATSRLMTTFYAALARDVPVAEALRQAQLTELRRQPAGHLQDYAAFRVLGDPAITLTSDRRTVTMPKPEDHDHE